MSNALLFAGPYLNSSWLRAANGRKQMRMVLDHDQTAIVDFLRNTRPKGTVESDVAIIRTHISIVLLIGPRAFKLKRAVKLPYVDFSTAELRLAACQREVELNRRTAPAIYLGVRRITAEPDGSLALDGNGPLLDAVVEMLRFDENMSFERMAKRRMLTPSLLTETANAIARFHAVAEVSRGNSGAAIMADVLALNAAAFATTDVFRRENVVGLNSALDATLDRHRELLDRRGAAGKVRRCHGDLHLGNICLVDNTPTLFDCIEFNDAMATIDVLYDLAFLLMDLWHIGESSAANLVFNRYFDHADEDDGIALLPFFMAVRASIRAHVLATQCQGQGLNDEGVAAQARRYFELAGSLLEPQSARLFAIGGLSGTGKSTIAAMIADRIGNAPGARVLASDRIRKRMFQVSAETRLPPEAYRSEISEKVYATQLSEAAAIVATGHSVVAEAVFDREEDRVRIADCARKEGVSFTGIWLDAPTDVLLERVDARRNDVSDATTEVVRLQAMRQREPTSWIEIAALGEPSEIAARVMRAIARGTSAR
ncbi:bifunctional aminoglycoside phosphotransferase/ATP-binding protein [Hyphomicrobium sp. GJ21]|uniref:bifunctional aminoglycoside phosphotransferase/ATP-binding protein n=1 Tax=Hyphomicrobium sp. GJ21 TaxID=113574 RepID=UPI001FCD4B7A|nr:bifunctional aminoglycoside phosphotransferase/ATP-binding protein [Hyphomicrobium sp. GJ21]